MEEGEDVGRVVGMLDGRDEEGREVGELVSPGFVGLVVMGASEGIEVGMVLVGREVGASINTNLLGKTVTVRRVEI